MSDHVPNNTPYRIPIATNYVILHSSKVFQHAAPEFGQQEKIKIWRFDCHSGLLLKSQVGSRNRAAMVEGADNLSQVKPCQPRFSFPASPPSSPSTIAIATSPADVFGYSLNAHQTRRIPIFSSLLLSRACSNGRRLTTSPLIPTPSPLSPLHIRVHGLFTTRLLAPSPSSQEGYCVYRRELLELE